MSKAERDLARLSTEVASTRAQLQTLQLATQEKERTLPEQVEKLVKLRLEQTQAAERRVGRRHRPLQESGVTAPTGTREIHHKNYWVARRSLRLWPVMGDNVEEAVISFLEEKLKCPAARVSSADFSAKRVYSPPENTAQHQVVVTLATVGLRDEVRSMSRNLSGSDHKTGVQLE